LKLNTKILINFGPFILMVVLGVFILNYVVIEKSLRDTAQKELQKTVDSVHLSTETLLNTAIENYLRGITEKNIDVIQQFYNAVQQGKMSEKEAKDAIQNITGAQKVGESGYFVAIRQKDERIFLAIHPFQRQVDCTNTTGCPKWMSLKNGYVEYDWKNPTDNTFRKKVSYLNEFKPWNWVVGATSYKDELTDLVQTKDLKRLIKPIKILERGYFYVFDDKYQMLIHPELEDTNAKDVQDENGIYILKELMKIKNGSMTYRFRKPSEPQAADRYAHVRKLEEFNWYIAATGYVEDVEKPIERLMSFTYAALVFSALILFVQVLFFSRSITRPLIAIVEGITQFYKKKTPFRMESKSVMEIDTLGQAFADMTKELLSTMDELNISEREKSKALVFLDNILNSMPSLLIGVDEQGRVSQWNSEAEKRTSISSKEAIGQKVADVFPLLHNKMEKIIASINERRLITGSRIVHEKDGIKTYEDMTIFPLVAEGLEGAVVRLDDVTEKVRLEETVLHSQKMESIGTMAGGIAHDFNNILSIIIGYAELGKSQTHDPQKMDRNVDEILQASMRARDLVKQIPTFSRQSEYEKKALQISPIIKEALKMIRSTFPTSIEIKQNINSQGLILADPTKIHQVMMNLCTNAFHAMEESEGTLSVSLHDIQVDEYSSIAGMDIYPGEYVCLEISDTGHGIDKQTRPHIFDPYFSTKTQDKGSGLGLAVVHGIISEHNGYINVISEIGRGTTFQIFLPFTEDDNVTPQINHADNPVVEGIEKIMLVDDEEQILAMNQARLEELGYQVTTFNRGQAALDHFKTDPQAFDLLITDMAMPGLTGAKLASGVLEIRPEIPIILCTGYSDQISRDQAHAMGIKAYLNKPLTLDVLLRAMREVLGDQT